MSGTTKKRRDDVAAFERRGFPFGFILNRKKGEKDEQKNRKK